MESVRWKQRFENFEKAYLRLKGTFAHRNSDSLSELEKEGVIQRFEYTFEVAWKTLMDYLVHDGIKFDQVTPRSVIKEGFASGLVKDGQTWIDMLEHRNQMSHMYDEAAFEKAFQAISTRYLEPIGQVYQDLKDKK